MIGNIEGSTECNRRTSVVEAGGEAAGVVGLEAGPQNLVVNQRRRIAGPRQIFEDADQHGGALILLPSLSVEVGLSHSRATSAR